MKCYKYRYTTYNKDVPHSHFVDYWEKNINPDFYYFFQKDTIQRNLCVDVLRKVESGDYAHYGTYHRERWFLFDCLNKMWMRHNLPYSPKTRIRERIYDAILKLASEDSQVRQFITSCAYGQKKND